MRNIRFFRIPFLAIIYQRRYIYFHEAHRRPKANDRISPATFKKLLPQIRYPFQILTVYLPIPTINEQGIMNTISNDPGRSV